jgi:hypothetical protein
MLGPPLLPFLISSHPYPNVHLLLDLPPTRTPNPDPRHRNLVIGSRARVESGVGSRVRVEEAERERGYTSTSRR